MSQKFYPTAGLNGSTYCTDDGVVYARTPFGVRKLPSPAGPFVHLLMSTLVADREQIVTKSRRMTRWLLWGLPIGVLLGHFVW